MKQISQTYANDKSFNAYVTYLAIKKHFSSDGYDYFKYNGKVRASFDTFSTRNDVYFFARLAKTEDYENLILSNVLVKPEIWVRELLDGEANYRYLEWKKKMDSLSYNFKSELKQLRDDYQQNFISQDGQHPYIMSLYNQRKISLETLTILANTANIFSYWDEKIVDKIVARDIIRLTVKYKPFLKYDEKAIKSLIRQYFF
jgi:hypothetical protein